jgi:cobalamin biosynthesis Mg chelatase CobN
MNVGKRHRRAPQWAHLSLLMSVIALALACFPALAQAECTSSSCVQYTESIPKPEGENTPAHHQKTPAKASKTGDSGNSQPSQPQGSKEAKEAEESEEGEASEKKGAAVPGQDGGNGQGKPGGSAHDGAKKPVQPAAQKQPGVQASQSNEDGGSSPLVPILIVIAVLAAISVAVVMIRQRRQRRGPTATASPEAN